MSNDVENYKCEEDKDDAIVFIAVLVPLLVMCCVSGCCLTKTGCFRYRRTEQSRGIAVAQGVQMGYMPTVYAQPTYGWPVRRSAAARRPATIRPARASAGVHGAGHRAAHADAIRVALGQPYTGQGSQDPGIVRYGQQSKVPTV